MNGVFFYHLAIASTLSLSLLLFLFYFLFLLFIPQLPTLFPPGKGPFASLARVPVSPPPPSSPSLKSGGPFLFFLLLAVYLGQLV